MTHSRYFEHYGGLLAAVQESHGNAAGVEELVEMLSDDTRRAELGMTMRCIARFGQRIIDAIKVRIEYFILNYRCFFLISSKSA